MEGKSFPTDVKSIGALSIVTAVHYTYEVMFVFKIF